MPYFTSPLQSSSSKREFLVPGNLWSCGSGEFRRCKMGKCNFFCAKTCKIQKNVVSLQEFCIKPSMQIEWRTYWERFCAWYMAQQEVVKKRSEVSHERITIKRAVLFV